MKYNLKKENLEKKIKLKKDEEGKKNKKLIKKNMINSTKRLKETDDKKEGKKVYETGLQRCERLRPAVPFLKNFKVISTRNCMGVVVGTT